MNRILIACVVLLSARTTQANIKLIPEPAKAKGASVRHDPKKLAAAIVDFKNFISCQKHYSEQSSDPMKNLRLCTSEYLSPTLEGLKRADYERWLFQDYSVTLPFPCAAKEEKFARSVATKSHDLALCFKIALKRSDIGYVYFKSESDGRFLISEIRFSNAHLF